VSIIRVGTLNLGNATVDDALDFMSWHDVAGIEEASDRQDDVLRALYAHGYGIVQSHAPGGKAVSLVYNKTALKLLRRIDRPLLARMFVGPGPGPDRNKPKRAVGAVFRHVDSGRRVRPIVIHNIAGQREQRRRRAARLLITRLVAIAGQPFRSRIDIVLGDFNCHPHASLLDPLSAAGYQCNHDVLGYLPTFGQAWAPDQVWVRGKRTRMVRQRTLHNTGDHRGLCVMMQIRRRRA
jgi:hypothetical protein